MVLSEPIKYFVPSIGISQIIPLNKDETKFLPKNLGAMGNEIKDQDLGLHLILLNEKRQKVIEHNYTLLNERVLEILLFLRIKKLLSFS